MTRNELINLVENTFEMYGIKTVTRTDINKSAYVPNVEQKRIFETLNINPLDRLDINIKELFTNRNLVVSYYGTVREGSGRAIEVRMGKTDLISYLNVGDDVLFTTDGIDIYIYNLNKLDELSFDDSSNEESIYSQVDISVLEQRAINVNPHPNQITTTVVSYPRNNVLRTFIKEKADYKCQMPDCNYEGFLKSDGKKYIEVHHLIPLSDGGEDSINNTVALCPTCHMKLHHADNKEELKRLILESLN
jgi:hypothetical protein